MQSNISGGGTDDFARRMAAVMGDGGGNGGRDLSQVRDCWIQYI